MQVGGLLEAHQVGEELRRGGQEAQAQARRQALGERTLVDPRAVLQTGAHRAALAGVVHQVAVGIVLEQRHAGAFAGSGQCVPLGSGVAVAGGVLEGRNGVGKGRFGVAEAGSAHGVGGEGRKARTKEAEHLQRGQVGGRFDGHRRTRIDEQLARQIDALLRTGQHQHPLGAAI